MAEQKKDFPPLSETLAKKLRALKQKKHRDREETFLVEGLRLCEEAISAHADILQTVITNQALQQPRIATVVRHISAGDIPIHIANSRLFNSISDEKSPQGILFVVRKKRPTLLKNMSSKLVLACDNLQDPGNLGTIFRSAEWFGVQDILLSPGCVDPYNAKVVRSSMGAVFRLAIYEHVDLVREIPDLRKRGYKIYGALVNSATKLTDVQPTTGDILLIGNEANGLSPEVLPLIDVSVSIPGRGQGESLNAATAASILLYHFSQT